MKDPLEGQDQTKQDYTGIREYLGDLPPPVPYPDPRIPPTPKYAIGDVIFFDRTDSDYGKEKEGKVVGTVSAIELYQGNYATKCGSVTIPAMAWKVSYWTVENDDEIPERCVLHRLVKDLTNG